MKKFIIILVALIGFGISVNAQKAYNTEDALAKGMVELFASIDKISVDEWVNSLMPNYKLAKQLGVDVTKYYFPETDKEAIGFLKELYSDLLETYKYVKSNGDVKTLQYSHSEGGEDYYQKMGNGMGYLPRVYFKVKIDGKIEEVRMKIDAFVHNGQYYPLRIRIK